MTTTLEELWSILQRIKQAARLNHTHCHTKAVKWLCNGTKGNIAVVQILSLRPVEQNALALQGRFVQHNGFRESPSANRESSLLALFCSNCPNDNSISRFS